MATASNAPRLAYRLAVEKRLEVRAPRRALALALALAASLVVSGLLIWAAGADLGVAFTSLLSGAFGSRRAVIESLVQATPLIFTGLAVTLAFRGRIFNIGADGQFYLGAMAAYWAYLGLQGLGLPPYLLMAGVLAAGIVGGAACGLIPALLKVRYKVDVIITTVMLNYVVQYVLSYMLSGSGPWRDPDSFAYQSPLVSEAAQLPTLLEGARLHLGLVLGLAVAGLVYLLLLKTPLGYEIRAIGLNDNAAVIKGISAARTVIFTLLISGGIAGLAGAGELFGFHHRLKPEISLGYGFTGVMIALLAGLHPLGVVAAAILFGALSNGAFRMQVATGVTTSVIMAVQAIILLFFLASQALVNYRIRMVRDAR
jgi:simple sugar transport system permease protein